MKERLIVDLKLYQHIGVSAEVGRAMLCSMREAGLIAPRFTDTGLCGLTYEDAVSLADALEIAKAEKAPGGGS